MRNSEHEIKDAQIRSALRNAECKKKLCVVSAVVGIRESRLRKIMGGQFDIPAIERSLLGAHLNTRAAA